MPATSPCGEVAVSWSTATVGGFTGELLRVDDDLPSEEDDPLGTRRLAARIAFANRADDAVALPDESFSVVACDGAVYTVVADAGRRSPPAVLMPGEDGVGWVMFVLPRAAEPAIIVVRLEQDDACRAWLGFPLRFSGDVAGGDAGALAATATPAVLGPCAGGSATSGAAANGEAGRGGSATGGSARGSDGADAVGSDAIAGDGCPGADASGADATGGDGGDGGDAVADGPGEAVVAPDCHHDPTR